MKETLIVGYGNIGQHLYKDLSNLKPDIYDKFKIEYNTKRNIKYNFCFICVDTPYVDENTPCDISQVKDAIENNDADIYVIKSTVLPKSTETLAIQFNKHIVFSPEFYGTTQHANNFNSDHTILGGVKEDCIKVQQLLQEIYDARHTFRITDSKTAELVKYMQNSYLGMKVVFCCVFYDIANKLGIAYEDLRELFLLEERVNPSHTFVYREHPYYDSHCFNKDIKAIAESLDVEFLKQVIECNELLKTKFKQ